MSRPILTDKQIVAFKCVMENGTVTSAAQRLLIAQPAVTRLIKQLEHQVGFDLFKRVRGRLMPTPEARIFYREVVRTWTGMEHLRETARRIRERELGGLKISAMPLLGLIFVPDVIGEFLPKHPDANIELTTFRSEQVVEEVMTQRSEIGLAIVPEIEERVRQERFRLNSCCVVPAQHRLSADTAITIADLAGETLICFEAHDPSRMALDQLLDAQGIQPRKRIEVSLAIQAVRLVQHGLGVAILDPISARSLGESGICVKPCAFTSGDVFSLITPQDLPHSRLTEDFIHVLRRQLTRQLSDTATTCE